MKKILVLLAFMAINVLPMNNTNNLPENREFRYSFTCSLSHHITGNDKEQFIIDCCTNHMHDNGVNLSNFADYLNNLEEPDANSNQEIPVTIKIEESISENINAHDAVNNTTGRSIGDSEIASTDHQNIHPEIENHYPIGLLQIIAEHLNRSNASQPTQTTHQDNESLLQSLASICANELSNNSVTPENNNANSEDQLLKEISERKYIIACHPGGRDYPSFAYLSRYASTHLDHNDMKSYLNALKKDLHLITYCPICEHLIGWKLLYTVDDVKAAIRSHYSSQGVNSRHPKKSPKFDNDPIKVLRTYSRLFSTNQTYPANISMSALITEANVADYNFIYDSLDSGKVSDHEAINTANNPLAQVRSQELLNNNGNEATTSTEGTIDNQLNKSTKAIRKDKKGKAKKAQSENDFSNDELDSDYEISNKNKAQSSQPKKVRTLAESTRIAVAAFARVLTDWEAIKKREYVFKKVNGCTLGNFDRSIKLHIGKLSKEEKKQLDEYKNSINKDLAWKCPSCQKRSRAYYFTAAEARLGLESHRTHCKRGPFGKIKKKDFLADLPKYVQVITRTQNQDHLNIQNQNINQTPNIASPNATTSNLTTQTESNSSNISRIPIAIPNDDQQSPKAQQTEPIIQNNSQSINYDFNAPNPPNASITPNEDNNFGHDNQNSDMDVDDTVQSTSNLPEKPPIDSQQELENNNEPMQPRKRTINETENSHEAEPKSKKKRTAEPPTEMAPTNSEKTIEPITMQPTEQSKPVQEQTFANATGATSSTVQTNVPNDGPQLIFSEHIPRTMLHEPYEQREDSNKNEPIPAPIDTNEYYEGNKVNWKKIQKRTYAIPCPVCRHELKANSKGKVLEAFYKHAGSLHTNIAQWPDINQHINSHCSHLIKDIVGICAVGCGFKIYCYTETDAIEQLAEHLQKEHPNNKKFKISDTIRVVKSKKTNDGRTVSLNNNDILLANHSNKVTSQGPVTPLRFIEIDQNQNKSQLYPLAIQSNVNTAQTRGDKRQPVSVSSLPTAQQNAFEHTQTVIQTDKIQNQPVVEKSNDTMNDTVLPSEETNNNNALTAIVNEAEIQSQKRKDQDSATAVQHSNEIVSNKQTSETVNKHAINTPIATNQNNQTNDNGIDSEVYEINDEEIIFEEPASPIFVSFTKAPKYRLRNCQGELIQDDNFEIFTSKFHNSMNKDGSDLKKFLDYVRARKPHIKHKVVQAATDVVDLIDN